jgi:hypothetical protein
MNPTLERLRDFVTRGQRAQREVDGVLLMQRARECLDRWASRRARTPRAKKRVAETNQLLSEIDEWLKGD